MHFLIVGPGAMGCLIAARLKKAGYIVTLLDYIKERADKITKQGIIVEGVSGEYTVNVPALPACLTYGETFEEALTMVDDAMQGWLAVAKEEGFPIPEQFQEPATA